MRNCGPSLTLSQSVSRIATSETREARERKRFISWSVPLPTNVSLKDKQKPGAGAHSTAEVFIAVKQMVQCRPLMAQPAYSFNFQVSPNHLSKSAHLKVQSFNFKACEYIQVLLSTKWRNDIAVGSVLAFRGSPNHVT